MIQIAAPVRLITDEKEGKESKWGLSRLFFFLELLELELTNKGTLKINFLKLYELIIAKYSFVSSTC